MSKHVFPLILDGAVQGTSSAEDWNGSTSYVTADATSAAYEIGLGAAKHAGTIVTFIKTDSGSNAVTVNPDTDFDSSVVSIALGSQNESCTFIWTGESWRMFTQDQTNSTAFTGGTVANATTFSGNVEVEGNVGFYNTTPVAQPSSANQAAVTITDVSSVNADVDTNLDNLATLVNQLRTDLVALGLIKGSA